MSNAKECAQKVLGLAAILDARIPDFDPARVQAWEFCFEGEDVWPTEALAAVRAHYSKPNPYPIMPGDVIAYIKKLPVNSSPERMAAHIEKWARYPYSGRIQAISGLDWEPTYPVPPEIAGDVDAEKAFHREEFHAFVSANIDTIVNRAMANTDLLAIES